MIDWGGSIGLCCGIDKDGFLWVSLNAIIDFLKLDLKLFI